MLSAVRICTYRQWVFDFSRSHIHIYTTALYTARHANYVAIYVILDMTNVKVKIFRRNFKDLKLVLLKKMTCASLESGL